MPRLLYIFIFSLITFTDLSAKDKSVKCEGTYTYYYSENVSYAEAKQQALRWAIINAMGDKLGWQVSSQNFMTLSNEGETFDEICNIMVRGRFVRNIKEPKFEIPITDENGQSALTVTVCFTAQELTMAPTMLEYRVLCNGKEDKFQSDIFHNGDDIFLSFKSPQNGYLAVFIDDGKQVQCMIPYTYEDTAPMTIKKGERYELLTTEGNTWYLKCDDESEVNTVHWIFSDKPFFNADLRREMSMKTFRKWCDNLRLYDEKLQIKETIIKIEPRDQE